MWYPFYNNANVIIKANFKRQAVSQDEKSDFQLRSKRRLKRIVISIKKGKKEYTIILKGHGEKEK
jgi:hypothetical protein